MSLADTNNVKSIKNAVCTALTLTASPTSQHKKTQPTGLSSCSGVRPSAEGFPVVYRRLLAQ